MNLNKNKSLVLLLGLLLVLSIGLVSAGPQIVTLTNPVTTTTVSGTGIKLSAENTTVTADTKFMNCTFYASSSATANSSTSLIGNVTNTSKGQANLSDAWNSQTDGIYYLEDSAIYSMYASCWFNNATDGQAEVINSTAVSLIIVNNSFPQAATTPRPSTGTIDQDGTVTFYATVVGENVTACTLYFPNMKPGNTRGAAMTHSGDNCSYALTSVMPDQTYLWRVGTTDGAEYTNSSDWTIHTDTTRGSHTTPEIQAEWERQRALAAAGEGGISIWVWVIIVVVVLAAVLYKRSK